MAVLGINSRAASPFKKVDFTVAWVKTAKTRRARIDAETDHRRVTRQRLRIIVKKTRGYPTGYLRALSDTIQHGPESREVGCETSFFLSSLWVNWQKKKLTCDTDRTKARTPKCRPAFGCFRRAVPVASRTEEKKSVATKFMIFASPENR